MARTGGQGQRRVVCAAVWIVQESTHSGGSGAAEVMNSMAVTGEELQLMK